MEEQENEEHNDTLLRLPENISGLLYVRALRAMFSWNSARHIWAR